MTQIGALPELPRSTSTAAGTGTRRVEKSPNCRGSHGKYDGGDVPSGQRAALGSRALLCRHETLQIAPLWYGPRLRAHFVAQIIGQVLAHADVAADAGYREDQAPVALIVDRRA
jgi:hypothetical protein